MTTETEKLSDLIRDVVSSYVDHGSELQIEANSHQGATYWSIRGNAADYGKLVGRKGAHFHALRALLGAIGTARKQPQFLERFEDPIEEQRRRPSTTVSADSYDPCPASDLLARILKNLIGDFTVESDVGPQLDPIVPFNLLVTLTISVRSEDDYADLVAPKNGRALVEALGALFRARANREGIAMQIDVVKA